MIYKIKTFGRFGNNVIQLINCISIALQTGVASIKFDFGGFNKNCIILKPDQVGDNKVKESYFFLSSTA